MRVYNPVLSKRQYTMELVISLSQRWLQLSATDGHKWLRSHLPQDFIVRLRLQEIPEKTVLLITDFVFLEHFTRVFKQVLVSGWDQCSWRAGRGPDTLLAFLQTKRDFCIRSTFVPKKWCTILLSRSHLVSKNQYHFSKWWASSFRHVVFSRKCISNIPSHDWKNAISLSLQLRCGL